MVDIQTQIKRLQEAKEEYKKTKSYYRRKDIRKYINRLEKELDECRFYLRNGYDKNTN